MIKKSHLRRFEGVVILGGGELTKALNVTAHRFTRGAKEKIAAAGGQANLVADAAAARRKVRLSRPSSVTAL